MIDRVAAIVLAAGKSERMGQPKALLRLRGRTFLENILDAIGRSSIQHTVVVVGHHREEICGGSLRPPGRSEAAPTTVFNPDHEKGMITSFQAGVRTLPSGIAGAMLFLVDHPLVEPATINALIQNLAPGRIVLPTFEGRRGHPVLFAREILEEILALPEWQGANIVVRKDPARIIHTPVNTAGILVDIDTPEQYARLLEE